LAEAIKTLIGEFKTLCPDVANAVVFKPNGETLAATEGITPDQIESVIAQLNRLTHAGCIGGLRVLSIQDVNTQFSVRSVSEVYLATVSSRMVNQKVVDSLTKTIAPMVIGLAFNSELSVTEKNQPLTEDGTIEAEATVAPPKEETEVNTLPEPEAPPEPSLPKPPITQFMVERIGGILVASDTVRMDNEVIMKWQEIYDGKQFSLVSIETLEGKTVSCKYKPLKEAKPNAKGIIQVPEKIIQTLDSGVGKLVMVKPVID
jgi:hypothetical protein